MATDSEIAANTIDRGETVTHRGKEYRVLHSTHDTKDDSPYILQPVNGRGHTYFLTRNRPNPNMLFGVGWEKMAVLPGWFTDKSGTVVSCG